MAAAAAGAESIVFAQSLESAAFAQSLRSSEESPVLEGPLPCQLQPPSQQVSPSAVPAPAPPELLQELRNLREWYEEVHRLERQIAEWSAKVKENDQQLVVARRQAAEARARKAQAAESVPKLSRARREVETRSSAMVSALQSERENAVKRTKDNRGLRRSLQGLHQRLGYTAGHTDNIEEIRKQEAELEKVARVEEDTLMQTIEGMAEVQERLTKQVASEREKRLRLKEAARAKLERVELGQAGLKEQLNQHEAAVSEIKERLSAQEERTHAAQEALSLSRQAARQAGHSVEQQHDARRAMHAELIAVQREHERLRSDHETTLQKLEDIAERESKAQLSWRLQHMERLDARIRAKKNLDQDVVVAEEPDLNTRAGGC